MGKLQQNQEQNQGLVSSTELSREFFALQFLRASLISAGIFFTTASFGKASPHTTDPITGAPVHRDVSAKDVVSSVKLDSYTRLAPFSAINDAIVLIDSESKKLILRKGVSIDGRKAAPLLISSNGGIDFNAASCQDLESLRAYFQNVKKYGTSEKPLSKDEDRILLNESADIIYRTLAHYLKNAAKEVPNKIDASGKTYKFLNTLNNSEWKISSPSLYDLKEANYIDTTPPRIRSGIVELTVESKIEDIKGINIRIDISDEGKKLSLRLQDDTNDKISTIASTEMPLDLTIKLQEALLATDVAASNVALGLLEVLEKHTELGQ